LCFLGSRITDCRTTLIRVVDQDRDTARHNIVRVELLDGEVPAVGGAGGGFGGEDGGVLVAGAVELVAGFEFAGGGPGVGGVVPEGVVAGGVDDGGVAVAGGDGHVEEVGVMVDPDVLNRSAAFFLTRIGVCGLDFVARLQLSDGCSLAIGQKNWR